MEAREQGTVGAAIRPSEEATRLFRAGLRRGAQVAGGVVAVIGALILNRWWRGPQRFTPVLLHVFGGISLMLLVPSEPPRWVRAAGRVGAAATTVFAGLILVEYAIGIDVGIDRFLLPTTRSFADRFPGRPSLQTAAAFLFAGGALLALDRRTTRGERAAQVLAVMAGSIPTVALLGHVFGVPELYHMPALQPDSGMSADVAATLVVLSAGILAARPDVGPVAVLTSEHAGGLIARRLLVGLFAFLPAAILVLIGRRLDWYTEPVATAFLVFLAMAEGVTFITLTAGRLNVDDVARKSAEARLRESEQRLRELFEKASDGIFVADSNGRYIDVNGAGCRMLGYRPEEILGRLVRSLIPPEDIPRLMRSRAELLAGRPQVLEWKLLRRDGGWLPVEVSATILTDGRWQAFIRDITDRKRQEAELQRARETDQRMRGEIEDVARAATTVSEAVTDRPEPSLSAVLHTVALQAQALTGAKYVALGIGTDPAKPFDPWVTLGMSEQATKSIGRFPRPVGMLGDVAREGRIVRTRDLRRETDFRGFPAEHPDMRSFLGVPIRYRGRSVGNLFLAEKPGADEFSDQDQRMIEMLASRAAVAIETVKLYAGEAAQRVWLRSIIDQMPEGVMLLNENGQVDGMNRALLALSCEKTGAVDPWGNPILFDVRAPDGRPMPFDEYLVVRALTKGEAATDREYLLRLRDGRFVPVLVSAAPVRDPQGRITGAVAVVRDVSAIKELERLREEWASIVAHDLRQPVGAIALTAEMLSRLHEGVFPEKERKAVERIRSASGRLQRMIDDLLDASRIEAKRLSLECAMLDLGALVETVLEADRDANPGGIFRVTIEPGQRAFADPDRIHQVLGNLISNAVKYGMPATPIEVACFGRNDVVEIAVTNQGPGIPPEELPRLFSRFGRTREARADRTPGLGLGLYLSKGLVEAHGGKMWVESVPGQRTSFHFTLPRAPDRPDLDPGAVAHPPA